MCWVQYVCPGENLWIEIKLLRLFFNKHPLPCIGKISFRDKEKYLVLIKIFYVCTGNRSITKGQSENPCLAHLSLVIYDNLYNLCNNEIKRIVNALDVKDLELSTRRKEPWFQSTFKPRHASQCLSNINRSCFFCLCGITSFSLEKDKHYRDSSHKQNTMKRKADIITSSKINNLSSSPQVLVPMKKNLSEIQQRSLDYDRILSNLAEKIKISKSFSERKMLLT